MALKSVVNNVLQTEYFMQWYSKEFKNSGYACKLHKVVDVQAGPKKAYVQSVVPTNLSNGRLLPVSMLQEMEAEELTYPDFANITAGMIIRDRDLQEQSAGGSPFGGAEQYVNQVLRGTLNYMTRAFSKMIYSKDGSLSTWVKASADAASSGLVVVQNVMDFHIDQPIDIDSATQNTFVQAWVSEIDKAASKLKLVTAEGGSTAVNLTNSAGGRIFTRGGSAAAANTNRFSVFRQLESSTFMGRAKATHPDLQTIFYNLSGSINDTATPKQLVEAIYDAIAHFWRTNPYVTNSQDPRDDYVLAASSKNFFRFGKALNQYLQNNSVVRTEAPQKILNFGIREIAFTLPGQLLSAKMILVPDFPDDRMLWMKPSDIEIHYLGGKTNQGQHSAAIAAKLGMGSDYGKIVKFIGDKDSKVYEERDTAATNGGRFGIIDAQVDAYPFIVKPADMMVIQTAA